MKRSQKFTLYVVIVVAVGAVCVAALLITAKHREWKTSREYENVRYQGVISGYVEPEEDDHMHVYIVFSDLYYTNRFTMFALPENSYEGLSDRIKTIIDNRETGAYLLLDTARNHNRRDILGYDFVHQMVEYDSGNQPECKADDVDLSWLDDFIK